jgi:WD40 repeat protein
MIVTGAKDLKIIIWDAFSKMVLMTLEGSKTYPTSIALSHDNNLVVSGHSDNMVYIWDMKSKTH